MWLDAIFTGLSEGIGRCLRPICSHIKRKWLFIIINILWYLLLFIITAAVCCVITLFVSRLGR